jgi:hypothetical protein
MLAIIRFIKANGLAKAIETFKLKAKVYENKILLKYDQIESNMSLEEVQDCRGLILERDTWKIMSMSFRKFFNHGEGNAVDINWSTASVLEKLDGTMIQLYWDWNKEKWFAATTGMAEGEGEVNNKLGTTFNDLFFETIKKYGFDIKKLDVRFTYVFELTTPYNIVVKPHGESSVTLLTARSNKTLIEFSYENLQILGNLLGLPVVKSFNLNATHFGTLIKTFENMSWSEEGYVVVDENFNRVKIKNPAYCAVHHLKGKTAEHNILTIIKSNEIDEFGATFPERKEELFRLKKAYDDLVEKLNTVWDNLSAHRPKNITASEKKRFAMKVFEVTKENKLEAFSNLYFNLNENKVSSVNEYMLEYDDKKLYKIL